MAEKKKFWRLSQLKSWMFPVNPLLCSSSSSSSLVSLCLPSRPNTAKGEMANTMDSSRIFVRNLPPNITEADFRKHFASKGQEITDLKLIPKRRIGYVGFKSPQLAADAAKYYNRSYIRMSKIAVEIARPVRIILSQAPSFLLAHFDPLIRPNSRLGYVHEH